MGVGGGEPQTLNLESYSNNHSLLSSFFLFFWGGGGGGQWGPTNL